MVAMKISLSYDSLTSVDYVFQRNGVTVDQETGKSLAEINNIQFAQDIPTIKFGAYDTTFVANQVEVIATVSSSSDVQGKLTV